MTVTNFHPNRVGQRVQEPYGDTRGTVTGFDDDDVFVLWDDPDDADIEVGDFTVDELRVVTEVRIDVDVLLNPALSPLVADVFHVGISRYMFKDGHVATGLREARDYLLTLHADPKPELPIKG